MRIIRLRIENFLSHVRTEIEFGTPLSLAIVGPSGAGKSALVDAIFYALTGRLLRKDAQGLSSTVRSGAEYHRVELLVEHQGHEYSITREYHLRSDQRRQVVVRTRPCGTTDWSTLGSRSIQENWNLTAQLFGIDADALQNTAVVGQMDAAEFYMMSPAERRNLLISMLFGGRTLNKVSGKLTQSVRKLQGQMGDLAVRRAAAARDLLDEKEASAIDEEIADLESQIAALEEARRNHGIWNRYRAILAELPADFDLDGWETAVQRYENQHRRALFALSARLRSEYETAVRELEGLRQQYQTRQRELTVAPDLERQAKELASLRERIQKGNKYRDERLAEKSRLSAVLAVRVEGDTCPTCGRSIRAQDQTHMREHQAAARKRLAELKKEIARAESLLNDLRRQEAESLKAGERLAALRKARAELDALAKRGAELAKRLDDRRAFNRQIIARNKLDQPFSTVEYRADLRAYTLYRRVFRRFPDFRLDECAGLRAAAERFGRQADADLEGAATLDKQDYQRLGDEISRLRSVLAVKTLQRNRHMTAKNEVVEIDDQIADIRQQLDVDELLLRALSPTDGAPALALTDMLKNLNQSASRLLRSLNPTFQGIELTTRRTTQNGKEQATLDVIVSKNHGVVPFGMLSGGEQILVAFTLRAAMTTHILRSQDIQFLILDEALSSLDLALRPRVLELIDNLGLPQVIVVTHLEDVAGRFPSILSVQKDNDISRAEWTGAVSGAVHSLATP